MSPQYGELRPTNGWDRFRSLGHPSKFQRLSRLAFITAAMLRTGGQANFARRFGHPGAGTLYIHFWGLLPRQNFAWCKVHFMSKRAFSYIGSVTAWHSNSRRQSNFAAVYKERNYELSQRAPPIFGRAAITMGIAHILVSVISLKVKSWY